MFIIIYYIVVKSNIYCSETCEFFDGYVQSPTQEDLDDANTEQECARLVKKTKPSAIGATWYKSGSRKYTCTADFGYGAKIVYSPSYPHHRGCLFSGIHINYTYTQISHLNFEKSF